MYSYLLYKNWFFLKKKKKNRFTRFLKFKYFNFFFFNKKKKKKNFFKLFDFKKKIRKYLLDNLQFFNFFFKTNFLKKQKTKKFIKKFNNIPTDKKFFYFEFFLFNILFRSKFFFFINDVFSFIFNGLIFINNKISYNPFINVNIGDKIQIILNKNFYIFFKLNIFFFLKNLFKFKLKVWNLNKNKLDFYKQNSKIVSKKIIRTLNFKQDTPNFLEIDFLTLSIILLYKTNFFKSFNFFFYQFFSNYMYRLYNWREK